MAPGAPRPAITPSPERSTRTMSNSGACGFASSSALRRRALRRRGGRRAARGSRKRDPFPLVPLEVRRPCLERRFVADRRRRARRACRAGPRRQKARPINVPAAPAARAQTAATAVTAMTPCRFFTVLKNPAMACISSARAEFSRDHPNDAFSVTKRIQTGKRSRAADRKGARPARDQRAASAPIWGTPLRDSGAGQCASRSQAAEVVTMRLLKLRWRLGFTGR